MTGAAEDVGQDEDQLSSGPPRERAVAETRYSVGSSHAGGHVDLNAVLTLSISGGALLVSILSLGVSIVSNRASGHRVVFIGSQMRIDGGQVFLDVTIANAGRADVDIVGAWAGYLGPTRATLPNRLTSASSTTLSFYGQLPDSRYTGGSITIQVGLGDGRTLLKQIRLDEVEIALESPATSSTPPPTPSNPDDGLPVSEV